jgi:hypothetical protein
MGICAGIFNVGALALMMDMTVEGATGMYMGLWGIAQAMGMGGSAVAGGALHTTLIGSGVSCEASGGLLADLLARGRAAAGRRGGALPGRCSGLQALRAARRRGRKVSGRAAILDVATANA